MMAMTKPEHSKSEKEIRNEDPLSGAAGAHPVGAGVGAALGGAATGAVAGMAAGPVGTVLGAIVGGVAGGLAGKAVAEEYDPTVEVDYWRGEYTNRPYFKKDHTFEHVAPAYRAGMKAYDPAVTATFEQREAIAREQWENEGGGLLTWDDARPAAEDAYTRLTKRRSW